MTTQTTNRIPGQAPHLGGGRIYVQLSLYMILRCTERGWSKSRRIFQDRSKNGEHKHWVHNGGRGVERGSGMEGAGTDLRSHSCLSCQCRPGGLPQCPGLTEIHLSPMSFKSYATARDIVSPGRVANVSRISHSFQRLET
jgi:hypothetical protein